MKTIWQLQWGWINPRIFLFARPFPVCLTFLFLLAMSSRGAGLQSLRGHIPAAVAQLRPLETVPATNRLELAIGLPLRNQTSLNRLLRQIYDPTSPRYHHYLTPEQFTEQFGPSETDYQAVIAFVKAHGLTVTGTHPNRMLVDVAGSVADIERVMHVTLRTYQHPRENRRFFAPDVEPSLDLNIPLLHVSGLDNYTVPRPMDLHVRPLNAVAQATPNAGSGPSGTYLGNDFRAAYVPGVSLTGAGQSVGLLEFDGYYTNDISAYESQAGLPGVTVTNVLIDGYSGAAGSNNDEVALDIEMAIAMAPGLSQVIVYESTNGGGSGVTDDMLNRMANDNQARQISASWSYPVDATTEQIFQQFAAQGQSFFNASGDSDAWTGTIPTPLDDTNITIVGGTTLTMSGSGGSWSSETAWNRGNGVGTGGGISTRYTIPSWQQGINMTTNQGSTAMRNIPDVAMVADNIFVIYNNGNAGIFGGTSCSTPLWAAFNALVNQQAMASGKPSVGFINPAIYTIGIGPNYASTFHDITSGSNTNSSSPGKFFAVAGYDLCTGWGTPLGQSLINALATPEALQITPATGFVSSGGPGGPFTVTSQFFSLTNAGTGSLNWSIINTSLWLSVSSTSGTLTAGGPAAAVTVSLNATASNLVVGTYNAMVWFTNLSDNVGQSRQFSLTVISPPMITSQPGNQSVLEGATASFSVSAVGGLPLSYQWQDDGTNLTDGGNISGSTNNILTISNVAPSNVGTYRVIVSNVAGVTNSTNAFLTITPSLPVILQQPTNQTVAVGETAQFTVTALGNQPFSYQWNWNGTNITGATNSTLVLLNVQLTNAGNYSVTISNSIGSAASSNAALTVVPFQPCDTPPAGLVAWWRAENNALDSAGTNNGTTTGVSYSNGEVGQAFVFAGSSSSYVRVPASSSLDVGQGNGFTLELWCNPATTNAAINPMTLVEWNNDSGTLAGIGCHLQFYNGGQIIADIVNPADGSDHAVVSPGGNVTPNVWQHVAMTYDKTTGILTIYTNGAVVVSGNVGIWTPSTAFDLYFGVRPAGIFAPVPYQGLLDEISLYNRVLSANEIQAIYNAGNYGKCSTPTPPVITLQPTNQTAIVGGTVAFSAAASGSPVLAYQWNFNGTNIAGATNTTLTLTNVQLNQAGNYTVLVTNAYGSALSSNAVLTINLPPPCDPPPSGMVAWWRGENNNLDSAGTNNGTSQGVSYPSGEVGQAFAFAGSSSSYVKIPASPSIDVGQSNGFTLEFWCNPATTNAAVNPMTLLEWNNGSGSLTGIGCHIQFYNGGVIIADIVNPADGSDHYVQSVSGNVTPNAWQHVAMTYDKTSGRLALYRNGVLLTNGNVGIWRPSTSFDLYLAKRDAGIFAPDPYQGMLDEVSLYSRVLSATEIQAIYNAGINGKCPLPPTIVTQPTNQTVAAGRSASFVVAATGGMPFTYQWSFKGTNILGATNATLILTNVQPVMAGNYAALVANPSGFALSSNALLAITADHFAWGLVPSPRFINVPFGISIQAQNLTNGLFTNFTGVVNLGSTNKITVSPSISGGFVQGVWNGQISVPQTVSNLVLRADDGNGHIGLANPISVVSLPGLGMMRFGNVLLIQWPAVSPSFVLETSGSLSPATWIQTPYTPALIGSQYVIPLDMTGTNGFYRLRFIGP